MSREQDVVRRQAIAQYRVIGEEIDADLDGLVQLAATICHVSTAVVNIIDDRFQHQIAAVGLVPGICSRDDSMCAVVLHHPGPVVVPDAREDARFASNPFVTGVLADIRFYASSPLVTPSGVPIGTLCVFDEVPGDLGAQEREALALLAQQIVELLELRRISRELEESNQQLESFAGQVSHDLRNPLTALAGFIELAADSPELADAPQAARALERAESAAARMDSMISDLFDYARIGGTQPRREGVELEDVVRMVLEDLDAALAESGARVVVDAAIRVVGDVTLLRALVQNLVANAVKFGVAAGVCPCIEIRASLLQNGWRLGVEDNGPGVPVEQRERVFGMMERGDSSGVPGLGIGLATCRRIVTEQGGRIGIDASPLGGAEVWVVLPSAA